ATDRRQRVDMRADPLGQHLAPARLGVSEVRRTERRDEDVHPMLLAGRWIKDRQGVAGPVDEQLLAGKMRLAHRRRDALPPVAVALALSVNDTWPRANTKLTSLKRCVDRKDRETGAADGILPALRCLRRHVENGVPMKPTEEIASRAP